MTTLVRDALLKPVQNIVWVVESLADDTPTLLSVHTDKESANAARDDYIADYHYGGIQSDYRIRPVKLNQTGLET